MKIQVINGHGLQVNPYDKQIMKFLPGSDEPYMAANPDWDLHNKHNIPLPCFTASGKHPADGIYEGDVIYQERWQGDNIWEYCVIDGYDPICRAGYEQRRIYRVVETIATDTDGYIEPIYGPGNDNYGRDESVFKPGRLIKDHTGKERFFSAEEISHVRTVIFHDIDNEELDKMAEAYGLKKPAEPLLPGGKEYILCAAIHYDDKISHPHQPKNIETGLVICGRRHNNCYSILAGLLGEHENGDFKGKLKVVGREAQGFITNLDRYVNRTEAWNIAIAANQIAFGLEASTIDKPILISENLY